MSACMIPTVVFKSKPANPMKINNQPLRKRRREAGSMVSRKKNKCGTIRLGKYAVMSRIQSPSLLDRALFHAPASILPISSSCRLRIFAPDRSIWPSRNPACSQSEDCSVLLSLARGTSVCAPLPGTAALVEGEVSPLQGCWME